VDNLTLFSVQTDLTSLTQYLCDEKLHLSDGIGYTFWYRLGGKNQH